jgi:hypothetical protein
MEQIKCKCGCGELIDKYDRWGRPREYKIRHFWRNKKRQDMKGENHWNWKGGRILHGSGYILIYKPDHPFCTKLGYVMEHRLVLEEKLGRYLNKNEYPHHKNGIKTDNRPENIELVTHNIHMKIHNTGNKYNKKDMTNRRCLLCYSKATETDKHGYQHWRKYNNGFICKKCWMKIYDKKRRPRKDLGGNVYI